MELIVLLIGLVIFNLAARWWGHDSLDAPDSAEWERRRDWPGFRR